MAQLPTVNPPDLLRSLATVLLPPVVKGPIVRRPGAVGFLDRLDADAHAVTQMQRLRDRYGPDPVVVNLAGRRLALVLDPDDVHRVLNDSPEVFTPASLEKRGALGHFQPEGLLISDLEDRLRRRPFNEAVLKPGPAVHPDIGEHMAKVVIEEIDALGGHIDFVGGLDWDAFARAWQRIVRRVVLGDSSRDDEQVTDDLLTLRRLGNFAMFAPNRTKVRDRFLDRLEHYVQRAEPGSLAELVARSRLSPARYPISRSLTGCSPSMPAVGLRCGPWDCWSRIRRHWTPDAANSLPFPTYRFCVPPSWSRSDCGPPPP